MTFVDKQLKVGSYSYYIDSIISKNSDYVPLYHIVKYFLENPITISEYLNKQKKLPDFSKGLTHGFRIRKLSSTLKNPITSIKSLNIYRYGVANLVGCLSRTQNLNIQQSLIYYMAVVPKKAVPIVFLSLIGKYEIPDEVLEIWYNPILSVNPSYKSIEEEFVEIFEPYKKKLVFKEVSDFSSLFYEFTVPDFKTLTDKNEFIEKLKNEIRKKLKPVPKCQCCSNNGLVNRKSIDDTYFCQNHGILVNGYYYDKSDLRIVQTITGYMLASECSWDIMTKGIMLKDSYSTIKLSNGNIVWNNPSYVKRSLEGDIFVVNDIAYVKVGNNYIRRENAIYDYKTRTFTQKQQSADNLPISNQNSTNQGEDESILYALQHS